MPSPVQTYYVQEGQQKWAPARGKRGDGGVALWLPAGVMVELAMVPRVSRGAVADAQEGMRDDGPTQGLLISILWQVKPNTILGEFSGPFESWLSVLLKTMIVSPPPKQLSVACVCALAHARVCLCVGTYVRMCMRHCTTCHRVRKGERESEARRAYSTSLAK
jgi:hypothetical protein